MESNVGKCIQNCVGEMRWKDTNWVKYKSRREYQNMLLVI